MHPTDQYKFQPSPLTELLRISGEFTLMFKNMVFMCQVIMTMNHFCSSVSTNGLVYIIHFFIFKRAIGKYTSMLMFQRRSLTMRLSHCWWYDSIISQWSLRRVTGRVASAPNHWFISISGSIFYLVTTSQCHEIFMAACFSSNTAHVL